MIYKGSRYENTEAYFRDNIQTLMRREYQTYEKFYNYVVIEGDTLFNIAYKCYNDEKLWWRILEANPQYNTPLDIQLGDTIKIPIVNE